MKTDKIVWAVVLRAGNSYGLPLKVFKHQKKAMKFAAALNDALSDDMMPYGVYPINFSEAKK